MCNTHPIVSWKSKKHDDEKNNPMFKGDFIVGINTPNGPATRHIKLEYWDLFSIEELEHALLMIVIVRKRIQKDYFL